jgi:tetratricopeptide (TPR) repeat protein
MKSCPHRYFLKSRLLLLGSFVVLVSPGCAFLGQKPDSFSKLPEESVKTSIVKEEMGDITTAVEKLKIALTIDPHNSKARSELKRLMEKRDSDAEKRFREGMKIRESNPAGAGREFIAALRIRSDYPEAVKALKDLQLESSEATIEARAEKEAAGAAKSHAQQGSEEEHNYLDTAISYYEDADYPAAIRELQKAKINHPNDPEINRYLTLSCYNSGVVSFKKKEYKKALDSFSKVKKGFEDVDDYVRKCRLSLKTMAVDMYKMGLKFYREQKLQEAIAKWNSVLEIEPDHQKAKEYIEKARKLQDALNRQR